MGTGSGHRGDETRQRARRKSLIVAFAALVLLIAGAVPISQAADNAPSSSAGLAPDAQGAAGPYGAGGVDPQNDQADAAAQQAELQSPAAEAERQDSASAYTDLSGAESADLMSTEFGPQLARMTPDPGKPITDADHVYEYRGDNVAVVDPAGDQKHALVVSDYPLRTSDGRTPDLELERQGDIYSPKAALTELTIPAQLSDGARLTQPDIGVSVIGAKPGDPEPQAIATADKESVAEQPPGTNTPSKSDPESGQAGGATQSKDALFYPEALADTDVAMAPTISGLETLFQLRSQQSPEQFSMHIDVPSGGDLVAKEHGGARIVGANGKTIASVDPPITTDAQGTNVPTEMNVDRHDLIIDVPHRGADLAYPLLLDPVVADWENGSNSWVYAGNTNFNGWQHFESGPNYPWGHHCSAGWMYCWWGTGYGLYEGSPPGTWGWTYPAGSWAEHQWNAPPDVYISEAYMYPIFFSAGNSGAHDPYAYWGLRHSGYWQDLTTWWWELAGGGFDIIDPALYEGGPAYSNAVSFGIASDSYLGTSRQYFRQTALGGIGLYLEDYNPPTLDPPSAGQNPAGWQRNANLSVTATAHDAGLGVHGMALYDGAYGDWYDPAHPDSHRVGYTQQSCTGSPPTSPCPASNTPTSQTIQYSTNAANKVPDGDLQLPLIAFDAADNPSDPQMLHLKVDQTGPDVKLSGPLATTANGDIASDSYTLNVQATDGSTDPDAPAEQHRSGVKNVKIYVDDPTMQGQPAYATPDQACPAGPPPALQDSCPLEVDTDPNASGIQDWTLDTTQLTGGPTHTVTVLGADQVGNTTTKTLTLHSNPGMLISPKAGDSTARRFILRAETHDPAANRAVFYFRKPGGSWTLLNSGSYLTYPDGSAIPAGQLANGITLESDDKTKEVSWDVPATPTLNTDGQFDLAANFLDAANHATSSQVITVGLDRDKTTSKHASASVGPGAVDLMTGNFAVGADDVAIDNPLSDLTVSRTFNSRQPGQALTSTPYANGVFGPGWIASNPVDTAASDYTGLVVSGSAAKLNTSDSTTINFALNGAGDWIAEAGYEDLTLAKVSGEDKYTVSDLDGDVTTFEHQQGSTDYKPTGVKQPGQGQSTTYNWETVNGQARVTRAIAPVAPGLPNTPNGYAPGPYAPCPGTGQLGVGCRALDFVYATSTTATGNGTNSAQWGDFTGRLIEIDFKAPDSGGQNSIPVAKYQYDSDGRLRAEWDPRIVQAGNPALKTTYDYDPSGRLLHVNPPGLNPWTIAYGTAPSGSNDSSPNRLASVSRPVPAGGTATTNVRYNIPLTGSGTPYQMGSGDVDDWDQHDLPTDATAIFPADAPASSSPSASELGHATITYMNRNGDAVNVANPGGEVSTTEYEEHRQVQRTLTPQNRATALAAGSGSAALAAKLDTRSVYGADGLELREQFAPLHQVTLENGTTQNARQHALTSYDDGAPALQHPHLPTHVTVSARVDGETSDRASENRTTWTDYNWNLRQPKTQTTDPGASPHLNLTSSTSYDSATGLVTEARMPKGGPTGSGNNAHVTKTIYYTAGANASDSSCGNQPTWANLPCKTIPAAQPGGSLPNLPVTKVESYNIWGQPLVTTETVPVTNEQRTSTESYDAAGRTITSSVQANGSGVGTALPTVTSGYDPATGLPTTTSTTEGATTRTVTRGYDSAGQPTVYSDADGNVSQTAFDSLGRPTTAFDGKGTTTFGYDATTRRMTSVADSGVGTISATYNADGNVTSQTAPAGLYSLVSTMGYDATGAMTSKTYKTCFLSNCGLGQNMLFTDATSESIHGQVRTETTTAINPGTQAYGYDTAGRLTEAWDQTASGCTRRGYAYDSDSNRTYRVTTPLNAACASTTGPNQTVSPTYDEADRLTGSGYAYDAFGRTLAVPAADAGGSQLTSSYYVDDRVRQMTQGSVTQTFNLDPLERVRLQSTTGQPDSKFHYSDDSDNSSWIDLGGANSNWQRFVGGPDGMLAATQAGHGATSDGFTYQLCDLHGDVIGTVNNGGTVTQMFKTDEFGVPSGTVPQDGHGWLGGKERRTQFASGAIAMGQRAYVPQIGRFLQVDPVPGGSANDYDYANQDPLNQLDLAGTRPRKRPRAHSAAGIAACHGSVSDAQLITSGDHSVVHGNETTQCLFGGSGRITRLRVNVCIEYYNQYGVPQTLKCKKASRSINPVDGKPYVRSITARCKSGTHKYRLTTDAFFHVEGITGHNGGHGARAVSHETRTFSC